MKRFLQNELYKENLKTDGFYNNTGDNYFRSVSKKLE